MDEPLASLDTGRRSEILRLVERLRDELGVRIVYVSHSIGEVTRLADAVVITDDNPRSESGDAIVAQILAGCAGSATPVSVQRDRRAAIAGAIGGAQAGDVVLVAGKGHESVQIVGLEHRPFSDQAEVRAALGVAAPGGAA